MTFSPLGPKDFRVLMLDPPPLATKTAFDQPNFQVDECYEDLSEADLVKRINGYNVVCISRARENEILTDEVLRSAHRLLAIGIFGTLTNQVDLQTAAHMGIPVFTAPHQHQNSVAELAIACIVLLSRQIGDRSREIHTGEWNKTSTNCNEVRGKTLGIVGYGHAGSQLGVVAESLSLRVVFYDTVNLMPIGRAQQVDSLDDLLAQSDYVAITVTPTADNANLFNRDTIAKMKKASYLVAMSAPDVVNQAALADAIQSGHLAGAAVDVHPESTVKGSTFTSPLRNMRNVILSPRIATETIESKRRIVSEVTSHIVRYIEDGTTTGSINFPSVAAWPLKPGTRRIICMHHNIRGVLLEIDHILSAYNVGKQVLDTKDRVGYLIADVATDSVTTEIVSQLAMLANTIRTRIV